MASAVAPAGSLQPPAAPLLLPTRPLRLGSSAAVRPALRDPAELRRGATPEEEALVADSRLDMALRRAARRTSFPPTLQHRPRRRRSSAAARELARQSSARSLVAAPRGRGLPGLANCARSHVAAWTCKAPGVTQPEDVAPWSLGQDLNRASKFTFKPD